VRTIEQKPGHSAAKADASTPPPSTNLPVDSLTESPPPSQPVSAPSAASGVTSAHTIASPAEQIAPALLAITQGQDGVQRLTLRLHPAELGMVQVQIEQPKAGSATVAITAERPETLQMLMRDQPQLHRALDQAGVPSQGRSVEFHIGPVTHAAPSSGTGDNAASAASQDHVLSGNGNASGGGTGGGYAAREQAGGYAGSRKPNSSPPQAARPDNPNVPQDPKWRRAGLDITA
jgi:flagellar hook-length control protein FliK